MRYGRCVELPERSEERGETKEVTSVDLGGRGRAEEGTSLADLELLLRFFLRSSPSWGTGSSWSASRASRKPLDDIERERGRGKRKVCVCMCMCVCGNETRDDLAVGEKHHATQQHHQPTRSALKKKQPDSSPNRFCPLVPPSFSSLSS